jgi:hypothetical protein
MRATRSTQLLRGVALAAVLVGLCTSCAAPAAALTAAAADAASSVVHDLTAPVQPAPAQATLTMPQLKGKARAVSVAQREAHRRGWPAMSVASTTFDYGRWEVSLIRLPKAAQGHAVVLVTPEGELLDFTTSDS